jgi:hypothetical protein
MYGRDDDQQRRTGSGAGVTSRDADQVAHVAPLCPTLGRERVHDALDHDEWCRSTMIPKSRAPMLSRLSDTPLRYSAEQREQEGERDHQSRQQGGPDAQQEREQHHGDDDETLDQDARDGVERGRGPGRSGRG